MNRNKRLALLVSMLLLLIPISSAIAAYSKTFTLTADVTLTLPDATPTPTAEPTPTPNSGKQVRIVYHSGYSNATIEDSVPRRSTFTLPGVLFERDNYVQIGWSTWPYSSFVEYNFGDTYRVNTHAEHFYAVWEYNWSWDDPWPWYSFYSTSDDTTEFDTPTIDSPTPEAEQVTPVVSDDVVSPTPSPTPTEAAPTPEPESSPTVSPADGGE